MKIAWRATPEGLAGHGSVWEPLTYGVNVTSQLWKHAGFADLYLFAELLIVTTLLKL